MTTFTQQEDAYIKANYLKIPIKRIAKNLNRSGCGISGRMKAMQLVVPKHIAQARKKASHYKPGQAPANKGKKQTEFMTPQGIENSKQTRFKKGQKPHNTKYNGYERITAYGYIDVRVSEGVYKPKHIHNYELVNGKIPKGHCLLCIDGNKLNCDVSNWKLISKAENMYRNSKNKYPPEIIPSLVLVNKINNAINQKQNGTK